MKKIYLFLLLAAGFAAVNAQIKIGGKKIDLNKAVKAGSSAVQAFTLSDQDVARMSTEYMQWMDEHNPVAAPESEAGSRLAKIVEKIGVTEVNGIPVNIKAYEVVDVNAFACGDGSIRVFCGLMDIMTDDEITAVIGHEIGHLVHADSKNAMKNALLSTAFKDAAGAVSDKAGKLTDSQLGAVASAFANAQFSQKQEYAADDYAIEISRKSGTDPYGMTNALNKLVELSGAGGEKASRVQQMFSTHPDSEKRAARVKEKLDKENAQ
ncbi:MAG: M48 family metalloprotease [Bacteroidales bacterium]|nr:M48 family metalloprotease [Bacteroidales bacterium]